MKPVLVVVVFLLALTAGGQTGNAAIERLKALHEGDSLDALRSEARRLLEQLPPASTPERYEAEWHLAHALSLQDDAVAALEHAQQGLLHARELRDTVRILSSMYQIMRYQVQGRHYAQADRSRHDLLALAKLYGKDSLQLALAHNSVGSMYDRLLAPDSAEYHYRQAIGYLGDDHPSIQQNILGNLGSTLSVLGRHKEATRMHEEALALLGSDRHLDRAWALNNLGQSLLFAERYRDAIDAFNKGDSLNRLAGNALDLAIDLAELRADCYDSLGDHRNAYAMVKYVRDLQDTLFQRSLDEQLLELEQRFETRLKEEEIARLGAQGREQEERLRLRGLQLYGSLSVVLLALAALFLLWRNFRQKRSYAATLEKLNAELREGRDRIAEINRLLQLKVLRSQMNPHFIYNCLNAIGLLVRKGDTGAAIAYLDGFARLLRMVLDHSVNDRVPISEEIEFLRQYLELESLRFGQELTYSIGTDADLVEEDVPVPALLVQPFVENAIWHGIAPRGAGRVTIRFTTRDDRLVCVVEDDGVGRAAAPPRAHPDGSASMGLQLTNERLQLLTHGLQGSGRIRFFDLMNGGEATGTRVELTLEE